MSIQPIVRKTIGREVVDQLKEQILSGRWQPGERIPGEMELTRILSVSRLSVRESIQRLAGMGILTVRRGEGTFVTEMLPKEYFNALLPMLMLEEADLSEILEFRAMMEIQSVRLAAQRASQEDISGLKAIYRRMEQRQEDPEAFAREDLDFHTAIAICTHNRVLVKVNTIVHDMLKAAMFKIVQSMGPSGGLYYHRCLLEAIEAHDSDGAEQLMREHLQQTMKKLGQGTVLCPGSTKVGQRTVPCPTKEEDAHDS